MLRVRLRRVFRRVRDVRRGRAFPSRSNRLLETRFDFREDAREGPRVEPRLEELVVTRAFGVSSRGIERASVGARLERARSVGFTIRRVQPRARVLHLRLGEITRASSRLRPELRLSSFDVQSRLAANFGVERGDAHRPRRRAAASLIRGDAGSRLGGDGAGLERGANVAQGGGRGDRIGAGGGGGGGDVARAVGWRAGRGGESRGESRDGVVADRVEDREIVRGRAGGASPRRRGGETSVCAGARKGVGEGRYVHGRVLGDARGSGVRRESANPNSDFLKRHPETRRTETRARGSAGRRE